MPDSQPDVSELAREVVDELDPGSVIDDKVILTRRQLGALGVSAASLSAVAGFGAGSVDAQEAAGQIGTESDPVDVEGAQGNFQALEAELVSAERIDINGVTETIKPGDNIVDTVNRVDDTTFFIHPGTYEISEKIDLGDSSGLIGLGSPENVVIEKTADDGGGALLRMPREGNFVKNLTLDEQDPDDGSGVTIVVTSDGDSVLISDCKLLATGGNDVRYYARFSLGDNHKVRNVEFGGTDGRTDDEIRIDADESTFIGCSELHSFDDRGNDNITAGNSPLDI